MRICKACKDKITEENISDKHGFVRGVCHPCYKKQNLASKTKYKLKGQSKRQRERELEQKQSERYALINSWLQRPLVRG